MAMTSQKVINILSFTVQNDIFSQYSIIWYFLTTDIAGGWEGWLQVEFAKHFMTRDDDGGQYIFDREVTYPNGGGRCDLVFRGRLGNADHGVPVWLELKTQRALNDATTLRRFVEDMDKMQDQGGDFADNNIRVAAAVFRLGEDDIPILRQLPAYMRRGEPLYSVLLGDGQWRTITRSYDDRQGGQYRYVGEIVIVAYRGR